MAMVRKTSRKGSSAKFVKSDKGGNKVRIGPSGGKKVGVTHCPATRAASNVRSY